ncbi:MAG: hypothetical protein MK132_23055 [Lentisphaerales bacterium]|nr:hypothetical protein [Lentisphaerales bacterium]
MPPTTKLQKLFFLHGGRSHGPGDHELKAGSRLLAKHLNSQSKVKVNAFVHLGFPKDSSILDDADAIIIL